MKIKLFRMTALIVAFFSYSIDSFGTRIFRVADPNDKYARYGKSPYSGPPFFYFASSNQNYQIDDSDYDDYTDDVESAFSSWNDAAQVTFTESASSGISLISEYQNPAYYGPAWMTFNTSGNTLICSGSYITLNTAYQWRNDQQDLYGSPRILDVESMVVHEAGHMVGIAHPVIDTYDDDFSAPTMAGGDASYFDNTLACRSLEDEDIYAARFLQLRVPSLYSDISTAVSVANAIGVGYIIVTSGTYNINDNLTINSSVSLELQSGVTLRFASGKKLTVNGTLDAENVTFESQSGTWYGIEFNHAASGSQVKYCNIRDAQYGIYMIHTDVVITGNIIEENATGLLFEDYADGDGIVNQNVVTFNSSYGIRCKTYSDSLLFSCNVICDNGYGYGGVYGDASSIFDLGIYADQGHNSIYYNAPYEVATYYSGTIYAKYNWWGDSDPDPNLSHPNGNIDWSNYLTSDPNTMLTKAISKNPGSDASIMKATASTDTIGISEVDYAYLIYRKEDYQTAASLFESIVHKYPAYFSGRRALAFLYKCNNYLNKANDNIALLDNVSATYANEEIDALAKNIAAGELIKQGDYQTAIVRSEAVTISFAKTEYAKQALFNLGSIYWYFLNDPKTGEIYYRQLIASYPDDDLSISALATLGEWQPEEPKPEQQPLAVNPAPAEFSLDQNYPNPFNPDTTIRYHLVEASRMTIKIYNLLGAEVITLIDQTQLQGNHAIQWNGSDRFDNTVANGVYWLRLQAGKLVSQRKLMLVR